jgi:uncharacterized cupredoxin-like copper-binding protein
MRRPFHASAGLAALVSLLLVACSPGSTATPGASAGVTTVAVTLQEFAVLPSPATAPAGDITFEVTNSGPDDIHEFVIIKTDLDPADLPVDDEGAVTEDGEGMTVEDEIEDIPVGETQSLTVSLDAGKYVLICNIVETVEGETEVHYALGMRTVFTVE